jgi:hypothetical protein
MFQSVFEAQSGNRSVIQTYYVEAGCVQSVSEAQSVPLKFPTSTLSRDQKSAISHLCAFMR